MKARLTFVVAAVVLAGCANPRTAQRVDTTVSSRSTAGDGYNVRFIPSSRYANMYLIEYTPPEGNNPSSAKLFALYRGAELAQEKGFPAFVFVNAKKSTPSDPAISGYGGNAMAANYVQLLRDPIRKDMTYYRTQAVLEMMRTYVASKGYGKLPPADQFYAVTLHRPSDIGAVASGSTGGTTSSGSSGSTSSSASGGGSGGASTSSMSVDDFKGLMQGQ